MQKFWTVDGKNFAGRRVICHFDVDVSGQQIPEKKLKAEFLTSIAGKKVLFEAAIVV